MKTKIRTNCDLCNSPFYFFKSLYNLGNFQIVQCEKCGLIFRNIILSSQEATRLYSTDYFVKEQKDYFINNNIIKVKDFTQRIKTIKNVYGRKGKLLDVGCAIGTFLNIAQKQSWQVYGQDVSKYAVNQAKNAFNLKIFLGGLIKAEFPDNYFDVVTMWDVVNHDERPSSLLKEAYRILKKDGLIIIRDVMEDSFLYKIAHLTYVLTNSLFKLPVEKGHPIHHSTFYTKKTLNKALIATKFRVIKQKRMGVASQLISIRKNYFLKTIFDSFNLIGCLIGMPLEMIIYAKK